MNYQQVMNKLCRQQHLDRQESAALIRSMILREWSEARLGAILMAYHLKGISVEELAAFVETCRELAVNITPRVPLLVDTCGTGGDGAETFNISTTVAFVLAACGVPVAKHGNRSVSSRSGSADLLEELGVEIQLEPGQVSRCIEEAGLGFLFAPKHHPAFRNVGPVRRELGIRTFFNMLGPLLNPAGATRQLIGVYDPALTELFAGVLQATGSVRAWVVHGSGLDELSLSGTNRISSLENGRLETFYLDAAELGLRSGRIEDLRAEDRAASAACFLDVLSGRPSPRRDVVVLNAAAGLLVADRAGSMAEGLEMAVRALESGAVREKFESFRRITHDLANHR